MISGKFCQNGWRNVLPLPVLIGGRDSTLEVVRYGWVLEKDDSPIASIVIENRDRLPDGRLVVVYRRYSLIQPDVHVILAKLIFDPKLRKRLFSSFLTDSLIVCAFQIVGNNLIELVFVDAFGGVGEPRRMTLKAPNGNQRLHTIFTEDNAVLYGVYAGWTSNDLGEFSRHKLELSVIPYRRTACQISNLTSALTSTTASTMTSTMTNRMTSSPEVAPTTNVTQVAANAITATFNAVTSGQTTSATSTVTSDTTAALTTSVTSVGSVSTISATTSNNLISSVTCDPIVIEPDSWESILVPLTNAGNFAYWLGPFPCNERLTFIGFGDPNNIEHYRIVELCRQRRWWTGTFCQWTLKSPECTFMKWLLHLPSLRYLHHMITRPMGNAWFAEDLCGITRKWCLCPTLKMIALYVFIDSHLLTVSQFDRQKWLSLIGIDPLEGIPATLPASFPVVYL